MVSDLFLNPETRQSGCCKLYFCNAFIVLCLNAFYKMVWMDPTLMKFSIIYALCRVHISNIKNSKRYFKILFCWKCYFMWFCRRICKIHIIDCKFNISFLLDSLGKKLAFLADARGGGGGSTPQAAIDMQVFFLK